MKLKVFTPHIKSADYGAPTADMLAGELRGDASAKDGAGRSRAGSWLSSFRGLLWAEWFAHSKLLLVFLGLWLVGVWTLPLFVNPAWILLLGGLYALLAGPAYGGGDLLEGCEEFSFALPPRRSERYVARFAVGMGTLLFLTSINLLALGMDLPLILLQLYVEAGIVKPRPALQPGLLYGLVVALPCTVFSFAFALAAMARSRWMILSAWFWAGVAAMAVLQLGLWYEELVWDKSTGLFSFPFLLAAGLAAAAFAYRAYSRKEVGPASAPITLPGRWWLWILLFLIGAAVASALFLSLTRRFSPA
jgi:hypothetical protein